MIQAIDTAQEQVSRAVVAVSLVARSAAFLCFLLCLPVSKKYVDHDTLFRMSYVTCELQNNSRTKKRLRKRWVCFKNYPYEEIMEGFSFE